MSNESLQVDIKIAGENADKVNIHQIHIPIHMRFDGLTVKAGEKVILENVFGEFRPGELVAIMGPSGSGKTTLLNFLAGRIKGMELVNGNITINGKKSTKDIRRRIGYVLQEDIFFSHLTVDQTLKFVGEVRLSDSLNKEEKHKIVDEVIDDLGLRKCADTMMGGGFFAKGCSGGEKKRCSIATELITNPSLLMMDEPTSGLDSSAAFNIMQTVKNLAQRENRTIVTTIHQPSSHLFHMFDKLILIAEGKIAYFGKASDVLPFFEHLGRPCYPNWNPADFIMDMLSIDDDIKNSIAEKFLEYESQNFKSKEENFENDHVSVSNGATNSGATSNGVKSPSPETMFFQEDLANSPFIQEEDDIDRQLPKWPTGFRTQLAALSRRAFIQSRSDLMELLDFLQTFSMAVVVSLLWFDTPYDEASLVDRQGAMFFVMMFLVMQPLFENAMTFPTERDTIQKERAAGMYRLSAYFFAKSFSELPAILMHLLVLHATTYWVTGLNRSPYFILSMLAIFSGSLLSQSIGLLIGATVKKLKRAMVWTVLIALGSMLLGGFYTKRVPFWMGWAKYLSHVSYIFNILLRVEFQYAKKTFKCATVSVFDICNNNSTTSVLTGADILPNVVTIDLDIAESFAVLWFVTIALRLLFYIVLRKSNKPN